MNLRRVWPCLMFALLFSGGAVFSAAAESSDEVIEKCVRILRFGDEHDTYKPTKKEAVLTLGLLRAEKAVPILVEHLAGEGDRHLRVQIARALGWIRSPEAVPALKQAAAKDSYLFVRRAAASALKDITGVEHEYDRTGEDEGRKRVSDLIEARRREKEDTARKTTNAAQGSARP